MLPRIPGLGLPSYGVLVAAGFLLALWLARRLAPLRGLQPDRVQDVALVATLGGLLAAKLGLLVVAPGEVLRAPSRLLLEGGVFYFGFLGGFLAGAWRSRALGLGLHEAGDVLAPGLALAHALGRFGCLMAGCCYGRPASVPWCVTFEDPLAAAVVDGLAGRCLHPVQAYEAVANLLIAGVISLVLVRSRIPGEAWWTYVGLYAIARFSLEAWRYDDRGHPVGGWSTSQALALVALAAAASGLAACRRRFRQAAQEPPGPPP